MYKTIGRKFILEDIRLEVEAGRSLAIVGESGSGKSTLARMIMALERPTSGEVLLQGRPAPVRRTADFKSWYQEMQFVFQNNAASLNPRMTIGSCLEEPLLHFTSLGKSRRLELVHKYAEMTGIPSALLGARPGQISGGQYQRACIARALIIRPKLLVCDEIVSNLDTIHQTKIIDLLQTLKARKQLTLLFITHNLSLVPGLCDEVAVMKEGKVIEQFGAFDMYRSGHHPYTQSLLDAGRHFGARWEQLDNRSR
ncbi:ABC transporter ATP-binding protein [Paenibacillus sp. GCM10012307]|uniref:ABC transporter ATP-binding protein n=1 Tax=Paenibacillus roseus TaxID=2798579 RepID=A0A934J486_9BACL|nr:ABC transporter ATP-binding protein [Paenibacillus roseus]